MLNYRAKTVFTYSMQVVLGHGASEIDRIQRDGTGQEITHDQNVVENT